MSDEICISVYAQKCPHKQDVWHGDFTECFGCEIQKLREQLKIAVDFIQHHADTIEYNRERYVKILEQIKHKENL